MSAPIPSSDVRACPFCGQETVGSPCPACGRDVAAARRVCGRCHRMTPSNEPACSHCGAPHRSELRWKVPLIVFLFVLAFLVSLLLSLAR